MIWQNRTISVDTEKSTCGLGTDFLLQIIEMQYLKKIKICLPLTQQKRVSLALYLSTCKYQLYVFLCVM